MTCVLLPCRSDDSARTCRLPLTHNPPALYSCFSWTYLRLLLKRALLASWRKLKSCLYAPHSPKTVKLKPNWRFVERSQWHTVTARSALLPVPAAQLPGDFHWKKRLIRSERCQDLEASSFPLMTCTIPSVFGVRSVRFYAASTTWTPRLLLLPQSPLLRFLLSCHGRRRKRLYSTSHLWPTQSLSRELLQNNVGFSFITLG